MLDEAAPTSGGVLTLSVNVDEKGASASLSRPRALVLTGGAALAMRHIIACGCLCILIIRLIDNSQRACI